VASMTIPWLRPKYAQTRSRLKAINVASAHFDKAIPEIDHFQKIFIELD